MNGKVIAAALIIAILILAVFLSGIIPGFKLPAKAQLVSQSITLQSNGGSIQNGYAVGAYWDDVITVNTYQNIALLQTSFGVQNSTNGQINGQTVIPTSQIYVTFNPGQPYALACLSPFQATWAQGASGLGNPVTNPGGAIQATAALTQTQSSTFYQVCQHDEPWTYVYPVTITVTKQGNQPFTLTQTIDAESQSSYTFTNPNNPSETLKILDLGAFIGNRAPPPLNDPIFFQTTVNGVSQWVGYDNAYGLVTSGFNNYWYGSQLSYPSGLSTGNTNAWPDGVCDSTVHPGWQQVHSYTQYFGQDSNNQYFYAPVTPSLSTPISPSTTTVTLPQAYSRENGQQMVTSTICNNGGQLPMDLADWLGTQTQSYPFQSYANVLNWGSIYSGNGNAWYLRENLPLSNFAIPTLELQISTTLVDTIVYQVNAAIFKFVGPITASSTSITAGTSTTVSMTIKNMANYTGTPHITTSSGGFFDVSAVTVPQAIGAGQSETVQMTVTALQTLLSTKSTITFYLSNDAGDITDTASITLTDTPQPVAGTPNYVITGINKPDSVNVGTQKIVTLTIQNTGAQGTAEIIASSEANNTLFVFPTTYNQTVGSGQSVNVPFQITALKLPNGSSSAQVTIDFTIVNGPSAKATIQVLPASPVGCTTDCPPGVVPWNLYIGISLVVVAIVVGFVYFIRKR